MNLKLITAPTSEPLTLTEVKNYLRLDTTSCDEITTEQSIPSATYTTGTTNGTSVDIVEYVATLTINIGSVASLSTLNVKIQDSTDNVTFADYSSLPQKVEADANKSFVLAYNGDKPYIRAVAVVVGTIQLSVDILLDLGITSEDDYLNALITTAREYAETFQKRKLITQTWEMSLQRFYPVTELPFGNLQEVDSVIYKNSTGAETTLTENVDYIYSTRGILGNITTPFGKTWASFTPYPLDPVVIQFTCGYATIEDIPKSTIQAMLLLISAWYEQRMPISDKLMSIVPFTVQALLTQNKIYTFRWCE